MLCSYKVHEENGKVFDSVGVFKNNNLQKTFLVDSTNDFLEFIGTKKPKTLRGVKVLVNKFNKCL